MDALDGPNVREAPKPPDDEGGALLALISAVLFATEAVSTKRREPKRS